MSYDHIPLYAGCGSAEGSQKDGKIKITIIVYFSHLYIKLVKSYISHESFQPRTYGNYFIFQLEFRNVLVAVYGSVWQELLSLL